MKYFISVLLIFYNTVSGFAQSEVTIKGNWERRSDGKVSLYRVEHGRLEEISSYNLDKDGGFGFYFKPPYEGIYVIGTGSPLTMPDKYNFYLKSGNLLNLRVNDSSYTLTGTNTKENKEFSRWHDLLLMLESKSLNRSVRSTYVDFFPDLEAIAGRAREYKAAATGNIKFDQSFAELRRIDLYKLAVNYIFTPRTVHPATDQYPAFYRDMPVREFAASTRLLHYPFGVRILDNMAWINNRVNGKENDRFGFEQKLNLYLNDTIKGEAVLQQAGYLKTYLGLEDLKGKYGRYLLTDDQHSRLKAIDTKLALNVSKPGQVAINFTYPDLEGRKVSLTDFKGKVVLVDVWATWCGPCKAELPSLKKMEEEMRDKDIVFMSVSVDVEKDHQKWKDFVAKEQLKGVQLFASGWSDIARVYDIKGIPRFMVFDKKGNIVTIDAPRPSGTELKLLLESELEK